VYSRDGYKREIGKVFDIQVMCGESYDKGDQLSLLPGFDGAAQSARSHA